MIFRGPRLFEVQHGLESSYLGGESCLACSSDRDPGSSPSSLVAFAEGHEIVTDEDLKMLSEISVRELEAGLQVRKVSLVNLAQDDQNSESRPLVDDVIDAPDIELVAGVFSS